MIRFSLCALKAAALVSMMLPAGANNRASAQSLTRISGHVSTSQFANISLPDCSGDGGLFDIGFESDSDTHIATSALQQSLTNNCGDWALTNYSAIGENHKPNQVNSAALLMADASRDAIIEAITGTGSNSSLTLSPSPPAGGLSSGQILVWYGTVTVNVGSSGFADWISAANGPGINNLIVDNTGGANSLTGTVVDVLNGTTTTYNLDTLGVTTTFSVILSSPLSNFTISTITNTTLPGGLSNGSASSASHAVVGGSIAVVNLADLPAMTFVSVTD